MFFSNFFEFFHEFSYFSLNIDVFSLTPVDNVQESFSVPNFDSDFTYDDKMVHEFFFISDSSTQIMSRRYQNLQDLLAILGGISSTYLIVANFFLSNYKKFLVITTVLNNVFSFEKDRKADQSKAEAGKEETKFRADINEVPKEKTEKAKNLSPQSKKNLKKRRKKSLEEKIETNMKLFPSSSFRTPEKPKKVQESMMNSFDRNDSSKIGIHVDIKEIINRKTIKSSRYLPNDKNIELSPTLRDSSPKMRKSPKPSKKKSRFSPLFSLKKLENSLKFGYFSFLRYEIKKKIGISLNKDEKLLNSGVRTYLSEMDILNMLKKLKEIAKLKSIVFDPVQETGFDSIPKPFIKPNFGDLSGENAIKDREIMEFIQKNKDSNVIKDNNIQRKAFDSLQYI